MDRTKLAMPHRPLRYVGEQGQPIFRVSYTVDGKAHISLVEKPSGIVARAWAQREGKRLGWTGITVGRWLGGLNFTPTVRDVPHDVPTTHDAFHDQCPTRALGDAGGSSGTNGTIDQPG